MASVLQQMNIGVNLSWIYQSVVTGFNPTVNQSQQQYTATLTNGTGAINTGNQLYVAQAVIAPSANTVLDFASGLNDPVGNALAFARVKFIFINNTNLTTSTNITVGNATNPLPLFSAGATTININNNGVFFAGDPGATGMAVGSGATDSLKIVNADGANSATVDIIAVGSTA